MRSFGSDNHSGVCQEILDAIHEANTNHAIAYGDDESTGHLQKIIKNEFGESATIFPMFNGTGANVCALRACVQSFHAILCPETAHIFVDECGAPELLTHAALKAIPQKGGKITTEMLEPFMHAFGFEHHSQPKVLYVSQCTELGTVYSVDELKTLADFLHSKNMYLHVDGARIANAAAFLNCSFKEITVDCGVDILSFGGTKNGMLMGESIITFRPELAENLKYIRKQSAQLFSKMRFSSAQFVAYFNQNLWLKNAQHANQMAQLLRNKIAEVADFEFTQPTQANIILMKMPKDVTDKLLEKHFFYVWNDANNEIRLVTSWDTTVGDIELFINSLTQILNDAH